MSAYCECPLVVASLCHGIPLPAPVLALQKAALEKSSSSDVTAGGARRAEQRSSTPTPSPSRAVLPLKNVFVNGSLTFKATSDPYRAANNTLRRLDVIQGPMIYLNGPGAF